MTSHRCPGEGCARCARAVAAIEDERLPADAPDFDGWQDAQDDFERGLDSFYGNA